MPELAVPGLEPHEVAFAALATGTGLALLVRDGAGEPFVKLTLASCLYGTVALATRGPRWAKVRLAAAYFFALWFYSSIAWLTPALHLRSADHTLLDLDRRWLGETPSVALSRHMSFAATEVMSACYLGYQVYLHLALIHALARPLEETRRLFRPLFTTFALGFAGYLLVPATGPAVAFPGLYRAPIEGGPVTAANAFVCAHGASVYDTFPSLHAAITLTVLFHDARFLRRRALLVTLPVLGLLVSTLYLRYHYFVDLVGGLVLASSLLVIFVAEERRSCPA